MKKTGIFGGSFNPIHNGHIALACQLRERAGLDEVWLMVSPQNPLKEQQTLLDDDLRLEMARLALSGIEGVGVSDYEFRLPRPSYTWNTLQALEHDYPDRRFTLLIGGDNWELFRSWYRADDIVERYPVVVYPRRGSDLRVSHPNVTVVEAELLDISSTMIRQRVARRQSISGMVPDAVARLIEQRRLYQDA